MPTRLFQFPNLLTLTPLAASGNSIAVNLPVTATSAAPYGVIVHIKFTLGSLTNATFVPQILNVDGSTWQDYYQQGAISGTGTLSASTNAALPLFVFGAKQFRVRYSSTGTVTSSAVTIDATCYPIY